MRLTPRTAVLLAGLVACLAAGAAASAAEPRITVTLLRWPYT